MSLNIYDKTLGRLKNVAGGGSAHIIINKLGNALTQRHGLKFTGNATITDDSTNDQTIVNIEDSGHTIKDSSGTSMTQRANLQFTGGATITDDSENGATKIAVPTIIDHLRSDSSTSTLSAKQGGVIANDMASIVLSGDTHSAKIDEGVFFVDKNGILRVAGTGGITAGTNVETNSTVKPIGDVLRELNSNSLVFQRDDSGTVATKFMANVWSGLAQTTNPAYGITTNLTILNGSGAGAAVFY